LRPLLVIVDFIDSGISGVGGTGGISSFLAAFLKTFFAVFFADRGIFFFFLFSFFPGSRNFTPTFSPLITVSPSASY